MSKFSGFAPAATAFLADLSANNRGEWFSERKDSYRELLLEPAREFVVALADSVRRFAPRVVAEPRLGGSLFRMQRDTRFSADKSPFKTHVGIRLRAEEAAGSSPCAGPVFYVEFDATHLSLGGGVKEFEPGPLEVYRQRVASGEGAVFREALALAESTGATVGGLVLARAPRGWSQVEDPLIRRKGLFIQVRQTLPGIFHSPGLVDHCARFFEPYADLFHALSVDPPSAPSPKHPDVLGNPLESGGSVRT